MTAELKHAFGEWVGDLKDLNYGFDDSVLPISALVGVYISTQPTNRTVYAPTHAIMQNSETLSAAARLLNGNRHLTLLPRSFELIEASGQ